MKGRRSNRMGPPFNPDLPNIIILQCSVTSDNSRYSGSFPNPWASIGLNNGFDHDYSSVKHTVRWIKRKHTEVAGNCSDLMR